jgi:hypothetical protein
LQKIESQKTPENVQNCLRNVRKTKHVRKSIHEA